MFALAGAFSFAGGLPQRYEVTPPLFEGGLRRGRGGAVVLLSRLADRGWSDRAHHYSRYGSEHA